MLPPRSTKSGCRRPYRFQKTCRQITKQNMLFPLLKEQKKYMCPNETGPAVLSCPPVECNERPYHSNHFPTSKSLAAEGSVRSTTCLSKQQPTRGLRQHAPPRLQHGNTCENIRSVLTNWPAAIALPSVGERLVRLRSRGQQNRLRTSKGQPATSSTTLCGTCICIGTESERGHGP